MAISRPSSLQALGVLYCNSPDKLCLGYLEDNSVEPTSQPRHARCQENIGARNSSSVRNAAQGSKVHLRLTEHPAACPPLTVVPVHQGWLRSSSLSPGVLDFGQGCDHSGYVAGIKPQNPLHRERFIHGRCWRQRQLCARCFPLASITNVSGPAGRCGLGSSRLVSLPEPEPRK